MKKSGSALSRGPTTQTYDFNPTLGGPKPPSQKPPTNQKPKVPTNTKPFDNIKPFDTTKNRRASTFKPKKKSSGNVSAHKFRFAIFL